MRSYSRRQSTCALVFAAALVCGSAQASAEPSNRNVLLFNPGDLFNGVVSIEYERALSSLFGISLGASVSTFRSIFLPPSSNSYTAAGPEIGARFHFIKDAPGGLWLGPSVNLVYVASNSGGSVTRAFGYGFGAAIGYNFIFFNHLVFQLGAGGGFSDYGDGLDWSPRLRLGIGGAF